MLAVKNQMIGGRSSLLSYDARFIMIWTKYKSADRIKRKIRKGKCKDEREK